MKTIYICTTEDKRQRIFYNLETSKFFSVSVTPTPAKNILIFVSIVGFALLRKLDIYKLPQDYNYMFYLAIPLSIFFGGIISVFIRQKEATLSALELNEQSKRKYILLGEQQLDQQKAALFFFFIVIFAGTCIFFLNNSIVTMLMLTLGYFSMAIFINYMDIFKRKKTYQIIKEEID